MGKVNLKLTLCLDKVLAGKGKEVVADSKLDFSESTNTIEIIH
jgi:hypothetical protein